MKTHNQLSQDARSHRPWLRRLKYLGIVLLPGLIVLVSRQEWRRSETKKLQETLVVPDRTEPGWRLADIEAARGQIPEEEKSARIIAVAWKLLPNQWPATELRDLFDHLSPEKQLAADDFMRLKQELGRVQAALTEARRLAAMPRGRHRLEFKPFVLETQALGQYETWRIVHLLCYDALRQARPRTSQSRQRGHRRSFVGREQAPATAEAETA
jgi:hypothetical protein